MLILISFVKTAIFQSAKLATTMRWLEPKSDKIFVWDWAATSLLVIGICTAVLLNIFKPQTYTPREEFIRQGVIHGTIDIVEDSLQYWYSAENILNHGSFSTRLPPPFEPSAFRTPGYALFLTLLQFFGLNMQGALIIQSLLGALIPVLLYFIIRYVYHPLPAWIGALLFSLLPLHLSVLNVPRTEVLLQLFLLPAILFFLKALKDKKPTTVLTSGLLFGLTALVKPFLFYVFPLIILWGVLFWKAKGWKTATTLTCILLGVYVIVLSPWIIRNYIHFDKFLITTVDKYQQFAYWLVPYYTLEENLTREAAQDKALRGFEKTQGLSNTVIGDYEEEPLASLASHYTIDTIKNEIGVLTYMKAHLRHTLWFPTASAIRQPLRNWRALPAFFEGDENARGIIELLSTKNFSGALRAAFAKPGFLFLNALDALLLLLVYGGLALSLFLTWRNKDWITFSFSCFVILIFAFLMLVNGFAYGGPRHRYPIEPLLYAASAGGWYLLAMRKKKILA